MEIIPYILALAAAGLTLTVALTRTRFAPILVAFSLIASVLGIEMAKGWPAVRQLPEKGILWAVADGKYVLASKLERGSIPRLYLYEYKPSADGKMKRNGGPMVYDLSDRERKTGGSRGSAGSEHGTDGIDEDDLAPLEETLGGK